MKNTSARSEPPSRIKKALARMVLRPDSGGGMEIPGALIVAAIDSDGMIYAQCFASRDTAANRLSPPLAEPTTA